MIHHGLYLLADETARPYEDWADLLPAVLDAGVVLVQYRAKLSATATQRAHAEQLLAWCSARQIPLLINDNVALCEDIGADGVHLGRDDLAIAQARRRLGPDAIIGASCYDDLAIARAAVRAGASYVSFGRFYASNTKPHASAATPSTLGLARADLQVPICAIGGITPDNAEGLLQAGAQLLCVAGGLLNAPDPVTAAHKLATMCARSFPS